jgi:hypothetical protein
VNSLNADEKENLLQKGLSVFISPQHAQSLCNYPSIPAGEMADELGISEKQYRTACKTTYTLLSRFLVVNKQSDVNNIEYELIEAQLLIELLKEKGQFAEALKKLDKALETAKRCELFGKEISFYHQYLQILSYVNRPTEEEKQPAILKQIQMVAQQQSEREMLFGIYHRLLNERYKIAYRTSLDEQQEIIQLKQKLEDFDACNIYSKISLIYYYQSMLLCDFMLGYTEKISWWNAKLLDCWQEQSELIRLHPELFIRSVSLQSYSHFLEKNIVSVEIFSAQYKELAIGNLPSAFYENWFAIVDFLTTLKVFHKTYRYDDLAIFFYAKWRSIYTQLHVLRDAEKLDILLAGCITYFVLEQWERADDIVQEAKELNQKVKRLDTLYFSFVFHCLVLYEKKEWHRLDSLINAGYHFLYSNKKLRPFEKDMLLFIKKLPASRFKGMASENIKAFLNKLDTYKENNVQKLHFAAFDFYSWFESKIAGVSYTSYMKNKSEAANEIMIQ